MKVKKEVVSLIFENLAELMSDAPGKILRKSEFGDWKKSLALFSAFIDSGLNKEVEGPEGYLELLKQYQEFEEEQLYDKVIESFTAVVEELNYALNCGIGKDGRFDLENIRELLSF